jgi:hypothetical protein
VLFATIIAEICCKGIFIRSVVSNYSQLQFSDCGVQFLIKYSILKYFV